jgi:hypothetical protein
MHKGLALALVAAGAVIGYSFRPASASAQTAAFQPFMTGQSVQLFGTFGSGATSINCTVMSSTTEFIACAEDRGHPARWVNLRFVQEITPMPQR